MELNPLLFVASKLSIIRAAQQGVLTYSRAATLHENSAT